MSQYLQSFNAYILLEFTSTFLSRFGPIQKENFQSHLLAHCTLAIGSFLEI